MPIYSIPDVSCAHCVRAVTEAVQALDPAASVTVDLDSKTARIACRAEPLAVQSALEEAGYPAALVGD